MSKKGSSPARKERATPLSDLESLHTHCEQLRGTASEAVAVLRDPVVQQFGDNAELCKLGKIFYGDQQSFSQRLETIHALHAGRKDPPGHKASDGTEHIEAIGIGMQYEEWLEEYQSVVIPVQMNIVSLGASAHRAAVAAKETESAPAATAETADTTHSIP